MKKIVTVLVGLTAVAIAGLLISKMRSRNTSEMLTQISDEGYETAHDVLFPAHFDRGGRLKYGPVIPRR